MFACFWLLKLSDKRPIHPRFPHSFWWANHQTKRRLTTVVINDTSTMVISSHLPNNTEIRCVREHRETVSIQQWLPNSVVPVDNALDNHHRCHPVEATAVKLKPQKECLTRKMWPGLWFVWNNIDIRLSFKTYATNSNDASCLSHVICNYSTINSIH